MSTPPKKQPQQVGPVVATIVILAILVWGSVYLFNKQEARVRQAAQQAAQQP